MSSVKQKKNAEKSDYREKIYDVIYTPSEKRNTGPFRDATAFMG
jgi:hypothetical protein